MMGGKQPDKEMLLLLQKKLNKVIADMAKSGQHDDSSLHGEPDGDEGNDGDGLAGSVGGDGDGDEMGTPGETVADELGDKLAGTGDKPDPFESEKSSYFKPRTKAHKPGTAMMIAAIGEKKGGGMPPKGKPSRMG